MTENWILLAGSSSQTSSSFLGSTVLYFFFPNTHLFIQTFQGELSNYSMANMILNLDLEDPAIDDTIRDWVKVGKYVFILR